MSGDQNNYPPVPVTIFGDEGYIWDADGVRWLRQHCRIVGGMTGCSTEQKQHKSAGGLPCKLSAEELALVQHQGWVTVVENPVYPAGACKSSTASCVQAPAWLTAVINRQPTPLPIATNAEVSPGVSSSDGADHVHPPCCQFKHCSNHIRAPSRHAGLEVTNPHETGVHKETYTDAINTIQSSKTAVLSSLHENGYFVTDGCKFGADYLLYPGDPLLYHAQFTVQVLDHQAAIKPALLMGGSRGSHSARKHLLLASVGTAGMSYITVAPEGGFGSTG